MDEERKEGTIMNKDHWCGKVQNENKTKAEKLKG